MQKENSKKDLFDTIVLANEGITRKNVRELFFWYDLFGCTLLFQIIFMCAYFLEFQHYSITMLSVLFVVVMDSILKNSLEKDAKNYQKFNKHISFVKLLTVPLIAIEIICTFALIITAFRLL